MISLNQPPWHRLGKKHLRACFAFRLMYRKTENNACVTAERKQKIFNNEFNSQSMDNMCRATESTCYEGIIFLNGQKSGEASKHSTSINEIARVKESSGHTWLACCRCAFTASTAALSSMPIPPPIASVVRPSASGRACATRSHQILALKN